MLSMTLQRWLARVSDPCALTCLLSILAWTPLFARGLQQISSYAGALPLSPPSRSRLCPINWAPRNLYAGWFLGFSEL